MGSSRFTRGAPFQQSAEMAETYEQINLELDTLVHRLNAVMEQVLGQRQRLAGIDPHEEVAQLAAEIKARCAQLEALSSERLKAVKPMTNTFRHGDVIED